MRVCVRETTCYYCDILIFLRRNRMPMVPSPPMRLSLSWTRELLSYCTNILYSVRSFYACTQLLKLLWLSNRSLCGELMVKPLGLCDMWWVWQYNINTYIWHKTTTNTHIVNDHQQQNVAVVNKINITLVLKVQKLHSALNGQMF